MQRYWLLVPAVCAGLILVVMVAFVARRASVTEPYNEFDAYATPDPVADETPVDVEEEESQITGIQNNTGMPQYDRYPQESIVNDPNELVLRDEVTDDDLDMEREPIAPVPAVDPTTLYQQFDTPIPKENVVDAEGEVDDDDAW